MTYTQPLLLLFFCFAFVGLWRLRHCRGIVISALAVTALAMLSWPPVAWLLSRPLEARFPIKPFSTEPPYQAIVVLSSAVSPPMLERPYYSADEDTFHRCQFASWLYTLKPVPILTCGGAGRSDEQPYAVTMRDLLVHGGMLESAIWTEERSSSTYENALYGSQILKAHNISCIALVVEATSMPRAQACFRKQGIEVVPAPSQFYNPQEFLLPSWKAIRQNELTLHEVLGYAWYDLEGWL